MNREAEILRYRTAYADPGYRMGEQRKAKAIDALRQTEGRTYLDVGCGRGEMLDAARRFGFVKVAGTEVVPDLVGGDVVYAEAHMLPFSDAEFDVATMFDVIEHLVPGDDEAACRELRRVCCGTVIITANNNRCAWKKVPGDLHINKRPYEEWDRLFREWFPGDVTGLGPAGVGSEMWRIDMS